MPDIQWTPLPGHHPGQMNEHVTYVEGEYRGMHCEVFEYLPDWFMWTFYDPEGGPMEDPDMAIAHDDGYAKREHAEADLTDYIDSYLFEREDRP